MIKRRIGVLSLLLAGIVLVIVCQVQKAMRDDVYNVSFKKGNRVFGDAELSALEKEGIETSYAKTIYPTVSNGLCEKDDVSVIATNENYRYFTDMQLEKGAFFNRKQIDRKLEVVVVNKAAAYSLFGNHDCVGEVVYLNQMPYQVIGIAGGKDDEARLYIPYRMLDKLDISDVGIGQIWCEIPNMADMTLVISQLGYSMEEFDILQRGLRKFLSKDSL